MYISKDAYDLCIYWEFLFYISMEKNSNTGDMVTKNEHSFHTHLTFLGEKKIFDLSPTPYTKFNSKWIMDLNVKCKTIKLLGKKKKKKEKIFGT